MNKTEKQQKKASAQTENTTENIKEADKLPKNSPKGRLLKGVVVSDKMAQTVTVLVTRYKEHPKYKKRYKVGKKYKAHDEKNECEKGDKVVIQEIRPISKDKRWIVRALPKNLKQ